jgi:hypothetical protein
LFLDRFSSVAPNILNHLISNTMRKDLKNNGVYIIDISYMAMINIIHYLKNYKLAEQYLVIFIDQFKSTYSTSLVGLQNLQCGIFSGIHVINFLFLNIQFIINEIKKIAYFNF